jgi:autotransporter-associated beta strand protein
MRYISKAAPLAASSEPRTLSVSTSNPESKVRNLKFSDVLVGEVWMCSGQSNMGFKLADDWNGDLEAAASKLPSLRLITEPNLGTQEMQNDFKGQWQPSTPDAALKFSAVGFLYGRYLHETLNVPVGLINNAWGGSAGEAWVRREALENDPRFKLLMDTAAILTLSGENDYTGNTTVTAGTLHLAVNGRLGFTLGAASGACNILSGTGAVILDGDFAIDTAADFSKETGTLGASPT